MLRLLLPKNLYLLPILVVFVFYGIPAFLGVMLGDGYFAAELMFVTLLSMVVYFLSYKIFSATECAKIYSSWSKFGIDWQWLSMLVCAAYFSTILYASITAPQLALFQAMEGATLSELSGMREEFLRTREGWERILLYVYAISIASLMPLVITQMFLFKRRMRVTIFLVFLFSLLLTLEKGRALVAVMPLIVLYANVGNHKKAYKAIFFLTVTITLVSVVARGGFTSDENRGDPGPMAGVPEAYNIFKGKTGQFYYILNRVGYIPYITAIDWLKYRKNILGGEVVNGDAIGVVAALKGREKIYLERDVFAYQWGQNATGTGSANTVFYVDAYLNFGIFGVILYSLILAAAVRLCVLSKNLPILCCLSISAYYVCFHSLTAVFFSGGLGFLLIFAVLFKMPFEKKALV